MTDYKQLCAELLKGYEILLGDLKFDNRLAKRARAVLARWGNHLGSPDSSTLQPAADRVWPPSVAAGCHEAAVSAVMGSPEQQLLAAAGNTIETLWQDLHQTILVHPAPVADDEVAELVTFLRHEAREGDLDAMTPEEMRRAADLLERLSPPQPVPVSERLPGDELCWWYELDEDDGYGGTWTLLRIRGGTTRYSHWLPAHALPLPEMNND